MRLSGIYAIVNKYNGKMYIGSAKYFNSRWEVHRRELKTNKHGNRFLQILYNRYGLEQLEFKILEIVEDKSKLIEREQFYIDSLKPAYNIMKLAGSNLGYKHTEETKAKLKAARAKRITKDETRLKMSIARKGRVFTEEWKANLSKSAKGRIITEEAKMKMRKPKRKRINAAI